jgi:CheY-like chemotaxis protein/tetratricopeptide (TPR) repeat protein
MRRILAVDGDALRRAVLVDTLRALGHDAVAVSSSAAHAAIESVRYDLLITDVEDEGMAELLQAAAARRLPVVLVGERRPERGLPHAGFLQRPVDIDRAARVIDDALTPASEEWSGAEFLAQIAGPIEDVPPARVLYLAFRVAATGALLVDKGPLSARVGLRGGRVVHVDGVPGLLASLGFRDARDLGTALGLAVAAGHPPEVALQAAADALGGWLVSLVEVTDGAVRFDTRWTPPAGTFPLSDTVPRILARGQASARTDAVVRRVWGVLGGASVVARLPSDSAEERWGLDALAMRIVRQAARPRTVDRLVIAVAGDDPTRQFEALRALDTLRTLGLVVVVGTALENVRRTLPPVDATQEDTRASQMAEALVAMEKAHPVDVLELGSRTRLTEDDVSNAYREISRRYHPDTFYGAPPAVRALAEACFGKVSSAYGALRQPGGLADAKRFVEARARGETFVSEKDHMTARVSLRRGEVAFRSKDYKTADGLFLEALRVDPYTWPHALNATLSGWLAKRLTATEVLAALEALRPTEPLRQAEVAVHMGNLLKQEGRTAEALLRYRAALRADPENRDAQREVRLHEMRNPPKPPAPFSGLLNRKK